jgi:hypothetical protein
MLFGKPPSSRRWCNKGGVFPLARLVRLQKLPFDALIARNFDACIGVMRALNRHVELLFNSPRKDTHWGKRKLARDQ